MVRLPSFENRASIGVGPAAIQSLNDPVGSAMQALGETGTKVAMRLQTEEQRLQAKADAEAERDQNMVAQRALLTTETRLKEKLRADAENMPVGGQGFYEAYRSHVQKEMDTFVQGLPANMRGEYEVRFMRATEGLLDAAAGEQIKARRGFLNDLMKDKTNSLIATVKEGGDAALARADADDFVAQLKLPENAAAEARRRIGLAIDGARLQRKAESDPVGVYRQLRGQVLANSGVSAATADHLKRMGVPSERAANVAIIVEQAEIADVDPRLLLMVAKAESGFNPKLDMAPTGKSSAFGMFQYINANWGEQGAQKTDDPQLQAALAAQRFKGIVGRLQANGVAVTPQSFWGMHFLGAGGFMAMLRSDPNADFQSVYASVAGRDRAAKAVAGNKELLGGGATVGQVLANIQSYASKSYEAVGPLVEGRTATNNPQAKVIIDGEEFEHMTVGDAAPAMSQIKGFVTKQTDAQLKAINDAKVRDGLINPYDPADRKLLDENAYRSGWTEGLARGDADTVASIKAASISQGYLPKPVAQTAEAMLTAADVATKRRGYETLVLAHRINPIDGLAQSGVRSEIAARVKDYHALVTRGGLEPDVAMKRVDLIHSEEFKAKSQTKEFAKKLDDTTRNRRWSEVDEAMGLTTGWLWWKQTTGPATEAVKDRMTDRYRDFYQFHFKSTGDEQTAKARALDDVTRAHNFTFVADGQAQLMPFPPEHSYPPAKVFRDADGGVLPVDRMSAEQRKQAFGYIADQAMGHVRSFLVRNKDREKAIGEVTPKNLVLIPTASTENDVVSGRSTPRYDLFYRGKDRQLYPVALDFSASPIAAADARIENTRTDEAAAAAAAKTTAPSGARDTFRAQRKN